MRLTVFRSAHYWPLEQAEFRVLREALGSSAKIASQLNLIQLEGLGIDYVDRRNDLIESVTREDLLRAARRFLSDDKLIVAIVGNPPDLQ